MCCRAGVITIQQDNSGKPKIWCLNSRRLVKYPARLLDRTVEAIRRYWSGGNSAKRKAET